MRGHAIHIMERRGEVLEALAAPNRNGSHEDRVMANRPLPSQEVLRQLLSYIPETGKLLWLERGPEWFPSARSFNAWNSRFPGLEAFTCKGAGGYYKGTVNNVYYLAHRVIWKMCHGDEPQNIDHVNGIRTDNRLSNLRAASPSDNARNTKIRMDNSSGRIGIHWSATKGKWEAAIQSSGVRHHLGTFATKDEAISARRAAEVAHGFHPNHGRKAATQGA